MSQVSAHAGQSRKLCLSAHGHLHGTLQYMCYWNSKELSIYWGVHESATLIITIYIHDCVCEYVAVHVYNMHVIPH